MQQTIEFTPLQKSKLQMFGAWCGTYYVIMVCIGWWLIAGFIPPHEPAAGADIIQSQLNSNITGIRIGMIVLMFAAMICIPYAAVLSHFLSRLEGGVGVLTISMALGGVALFVLTFYPAIWWLTAVFRPERGADFMQLMNDQAWLQLIGGLAPFLWMLICIAIAAFMDKNPEPVFPRWFGYFNVWVTVLLLPGQLLFFFKTGPFAWNGLLAFWMPLTVFGGWFFVTTAVLRKAILREREQIGA